MEDQPKPPLFIEVCVGSLDDAKSAELCGAARLELCSALELGGLTPSLGLVCEVIESVALPVVVMLRPRASGFCYSEAEFRCMLRDAKLAIEAGAAGIVFGILNKDSSIHRERTKMLVDLAGSCETVFHRAFDFVVDPFETLDTLIELGVTRVLTTGGGKTAIESSSMLAKLVQQAENSIQIMAAGGVRPDNITQLREKTGCMQFHTGVSTSATDPSISRQAAVRLCETERISMGEFSVIDQDELTRFS